MKGEGKWIWLAGDAGTDYNEAAEFRATFACAKKPRRAHISIAADTWYRLRVNGVWAGDGPGRSCPEHFRYDVIDLAKLLKAGENTLEILVRYFGCGTFHQVPRRGGLIFEVEADGKVAAASGADVAARRWTPSAPRGRSPAATKSKWRPPRKRQSPPPTNWRRAKGCPGRGGRRGRALRQRSRPRAPRTTARRWVRGRAAWRPRAREWCWGRQAYGKTMADLNGRGRRPAPRQAAKRGGRPPLPAFSRCRR